MKYFPSFFKSRLELPGGGGVVERGALWSEKRAANATGKDLEGEGEEGEEEREGEGEEEASDAARRRKCEKKKSANWPSVIHYTLPFSKLSRFEPPPEPPPFSDVPLRIGDSARKSLLRALLDCEAIVFGQEWRRKRRRSRRRRFFFRFRSTALSTTSTAGHLRVARRLQPPVSPVAFPDEGIFGQRARQRYVCAQDCLQI